MYFGRLSSPWLKKILNFKVLRCTIPLSIFSNFLSFLLALNTVCMYRYQDYHSYPKFRTGFFYRVECFGRKKCNRNTDFHAKFSSQPGFKFSGQRNIPNFFPEGGPKKKVVYETYPTIFWIIFQSDCLLWVLRSEWVRWKINKSHVCFS